MHTCLVHKVCGRNVILSCSCSRVHVPCASCTPTALRIKLSMTIITRRHEFVILPDQMRHLQCLLHPAQQLALPYTWPAGQHKQLDTKSRPSLRAAPSCLGLMEPAVAAPVRILPCYRDLQWPPERLAEHPGHCASQHAAAVSQHLHMKARTRFRCNNASIRVGCVLGVRLGYGGTSAQLLQQLQAGCCLPACYLARAWLA